MNNPYSTPPIEVIITLIQDIKVIIKIDILLMILIYLYLGDILKAIKNKIEMGSLAGKKIGREWGRNTKNQRKR